MAPVTVASAPHVTNAPRPWRVLLSTLLIVALIGTGNPRAAQQTSNAPALRVIVIDGDEAANIVDEKMAAEPIIEVRDRDDRSVAGAVVRFQIRRGLRNRLSAAFGGGRDELRTLTDSAGRARASGLTPLEAGRFEIEVQVSHQGQSATTTIRHTNFSSAAQARAAGRQPGQSSGAPAAGAGAAGTAGVAAGTTGGSATAVAGGGLSKLAIGSIALGSAAAAGAAVVLTRREERNGEPTVQQIVASRSVALAAATPVAFSVQAADPDGGQLTYRWDFGDGGSSSQPAPSHVYAAPGTFGASVTVTDGQATLMRSISVTVKSLTGTWVSDPFQGSAFPGGPPFTTHYSATLSQSGNSVAGSVVILGRPPQWDPGPVSVSGTTSTSSPFVRLQGLFFVPIPSIIQLVADPDGTVDELRDQNGLTYRRQ